MNARVFEFASAPPIPKESRSEYDTWEAGFDACTTAERCKQTEEVVNPYTGAQGVIWQAGFAASRRVTEIAREAA